MGTFLPLFIHSLPCFKLLPFEMIIEFRISQIESDLVALVKKLTAPLFELFDYYEVSDSLYEQLVHNFTHGQT